MVPRLYSADTTNYGATAGIGSLVDAISCTVTETRNSSYELEMEYPITGAHFAEITRSRIIFAKANAIDSYPQPFRIYDISKPIAGIVTVHASHVAYDLDGIPVKPFTATTAAEALTALKSGSLVTNNFTFTTDVTTNNPYKLETPKNAWGVLADIVSYYGGDLHFDGWNVKLLKNRGSDKHAVLSYGKNLTDLTQGESIADTYTGCIAYWMSSDKATSVYSDAQYAADHANFAAEKIYMLDCSSEFKDTPTVSDLNAKAAKYVTDAQLGKPTVSIDVSYADFAKSVEYAGIPQPTIGLCDTVTVIYSALGVDSKAKVIKTTYDTLAESYTRLNLGDARPTVYSTIRDMTESWAHDLSQQISRQISQQAIATQQHMDAVADLIASNTGISKSNTFMKYLSTPVDFMPVGEAHAIYTFTSADMQEIGIKTIKKLQFEGKFNFIDGPIQYVGFDFSAGGISADADITSAFEADWLTDMTLTGLDTRGTTNMSSLFSEAKLFGFFDASGLDTRNVTDMSYMFCVAKGPNRIIDLSSWDVRNVKDFTEMFAGSSMSNTTLNLTGWGKQISPGATLTSMLGWEGDEWNTAEEILLLDNAEDFNTRILTETGLADSTDTIRHARIVVKDEAYAAITAMPALSAFVSARRIIRYSDSRANARGLLKSSS